MNASTRYDGHPRLPALFVAVVFTLFLAFTGNSFDAYTEQTWIAGHGGADAIDYWRIARAAPGRPDPGVPYHRAQRWLYPYLIGLLARAADLDPWQLFRAFNLALATISIMLFFVIVRHFIPDARYALVLTSVFAFNPYLFRFYLAFPGMLTDAVFIVGELMVLLGVVRNRFGWILAGLLIAICARQSALAFLPGVLGFILSRPATSLVQRLGVTVSTAVLCAAVYEYLSLSAGEFSTPESNLRYLTGIFSYAAHNPATVPLLQHIGRWLFGFALLLAVALAARPEKMSGTSLWLMFIGLGVALQPALAGPELSGGSVQRLAMLSLPALAAALYAAPLPARADPPGAIALVTLLTVALGSLHHNYSIIGPDTSLRFIFVALFLFSAVSVYFFVARACANHGMGRR